MKLDDRLIGLEAILENGMPTIKDVSVAEVPVEANDRNHNLYGPIESFEGDAVLIDGEWWLCGSGFAADQDGGDHEVECEYKVGNLDNLIELIGE